MEIGDQTVKNISGPVVCYYLKPNEKVFEIFKNYSIELPMLLLFGDIHGSNHGMCTDCEISKGCYRIYDEDLLKLLDSLSTDKNPVDFYIETSEEIYDKYKGEEQKQRNEPLVDLIFYSEICFKRKLRDSIEYKEKCPTKNIRWHYSDPRDKKGYIEDNIHKLSKYLLKSEYENISSIMYIDIIKDLLINSIDDENKFDISVFSKLFFNLEKNKNDKYISLNIKQINKHLYFELEDINRTTLWIDILNSLISHRIEEIHEIKDIKNLILNIDNIDYMTSYKKNNIRSFRMLYKLLNSMSVSFVDLYFTSRILKGERTQASLVVSYLGLEHIEYIKIIFENIFNYDLANTIGNDKIYEQFIQLSKLTNIQINDMAIDRCLSFIGGVQDDINLSKDIHLHNLKRE
jgi:hypothetical protein